MKKIQTSVRSLFGRKLSLLLCAAILTFAAIGAHMLTKPVYAQNPRQPVKQLRQIRHRKSRPLCSTAQVGYASCLSYVATDDSGNNLATNLLVFGSYGPTEFHTAYNLPCTPGGAVASVCATPANFGPQTIAIVNAGNLTSGGATVENSLQTFNQRFGLPACTIANGCLTIVNQSGNTSPLPAEIPGWGEEIALDVETAHMICQTCKIVLVEATSNTVSNLAIANDTAATFNPISISNSWIAIGSNLSGYDSHFVHPGIATVAGTGDNGAEDGGLGWPANIPEVVAASGTTLGLNVDNTWASETVWGGSGGGCASVYNAPSWQTSLPNWGTNGCGTKRSFGDVSAAGDPNTGAMISIGSTWYQFGGTSLSTPLIAAMYALVGSIPSGATASSIPYSSFTSANFHDITSGSNCTITVIANCTALVGFDAPSGVGSPIGLGGFSPPPSQPANFATTVASQASVNLSWNASTGNVAINNYKIYRNGVQVGTSNSTTYSDSGLTANTAYTYHVVAQDVLGNLSPATSDSAVTTYYLEDINQDAHINLLDFSLLASKYNQSGAGLGRTDINGDNAVSLLDFSLLAGKYNLE